MALPRCLSSDVSSQMASPRCLLKCLLPDVSPQMLPPRCLLPDNAKTLFRVSCWCHLMELLQKAAKCGRFMKMNFQSPLRNPELPDHWELVPESPPSHSQSFPKCNSSDVSSQMFPARCFLRALLNNTTDDPR